MEILGPNGLASFAGRLALSASGLALSAGRMKPVRRRMNPVRHEMKPFLLVLIFFPYFALFSNVLFLSPARVLPSESALTNTFS